MNLKEVCDHRFLVTLVDDVVKADRKLTFAEIIPNHVLGSIPKKRCLALIKLDCNNLSEKFLIENFSLQKESVKIS